MKKFTKQEIIELYGQVTMGEISFSEMVEMINDRVSEANEPQYKDGDFVVPVDGVVLIFKKKVGDFIYDHAYYTEMLGEVIFSNSPYRSPIERYATETEKQELLNALAKAGKRWNAEKKCIEDIPSYKKGDFLVKEYKDGVQYTFILDYIDDKGLIYYHCCYGNISNITYVKDDSGIGSIGDVYHKCLRYATDSEKELLITELSKVGKRWNEDKKCIEDIPKFKNGDFVVGFGCVFILHTQIDKYSAQYYALYAKTNGNVYYYRTYSQLGGIDELRLATEAEKQELLDALAKRGKRWNAEKLCIENIQVRKFKIGDKVRIKNGVSSRTHGSIRPFFANSMDELIGKVLTVEYCDNSEYVICDGYSFLKEWLEPYEELKKGDLAIFWDEAKKCAIIRIYDQLDESEDYLQNKDNTGIFWDNAIKFESKEQYEKLLKGEI